MVLRGVTADRLREEASKRGLGVEEYLLELLTQGLNPRDRAREYVRASEELLAGAREELERGNVRQAAEKIWGASALAVRAYALWRDGRRLASHGELWEYKRKLEEGEGRWVHDAWMNAVGMHVCFYEGWCSRSDVEKALEAVERLVKAVAKIVS